jgi:tRNA uridine 5-carboxymethylaminomethyl modification enzyme
MFTSRAEYRLTLRADNADRRLTPKGRALGIVGTERSQAFATKEAALAAAERQLRALRLSPTEGGRHGLQVKHDGRVRDGLELLQLPGIDIARLAAVRPELSGLRADVVEQLETEARYATYLTRQVADIGAFRAEEALLLPGDLDIDAIKGLSTEVRARLAESRPATLGAAARLPGMTPAALTILCRYARRAA